jgi:S-methylmethionine-dependent homocysteine/selenocysteine methylase
MVVASDVIVLDGAVGHLLKSKGVESLVRGLEVPYDKLFVAGALANAERPELVTAVHEAMIDAGADIITTNTFGCTQWALECIGRGEEARELAIAGARLAREAADHAQRPVLVAGSLPPLEESYRVEGRMEFELMQPEYKELAAALTPYVDLFLCETLSTSAEGMAAASAAYSIAPSMPWWVSFTVQDNRKALLRSGERLKDALRSVARIPGMEAALVNCCCPQAVTAAIPTLLETVPEGARVGGYPNAFRKTTSAWLGEGEGGSSEGDIERLPAEEYDADGILLPRALRRHAGEWVGLGATVVGGCCGTGPEHIVQLKGLKNGVGDGA